jgi:predicted ATPase/DNA-binding CsgD family transcriptional regulator
MELGRQTRLKTAGVTAREAEVLAAIGRRSTNHEIAAQLTISVRTVESHVSALLRKLGLPDRPALVRLAQELPGELTIPTPVTSLVGRDDELAELSDLLVACALVTVVGPAGCGKTRLALEAARRWHGEARVIGLSSAAQRDVDALIASGLGIGYEARDVIAAARVALAGRGMLVVVDNCEHVIEAAGAALGALAGAVPGLRLLATSREPLGVNAENVLALSPLEVPAGPRLEDVRASAAGRLFLDRALAASSRFRLDEASAPHIAAICRRLDGLPLAIELAAARIRDLDAGGLAAALQDRISVLEWPARDGQQRSFASAVEWSWQLLDDAERRLLRRLAVLPGEFTLVLAETVGRDEAAIGVRSTLMRLVEQSLVNMRLPPRQPARYWLLGVIRVFVLDHADPAADEQVARGHAQFFCLAAEEAAHAACHPGTAAPSPARFDEPNMLAALAWSASHDPGLADRLLLSVSQFAEFEPSRRALEVIRDLALGSPPDWSCEALARAAVVVGFLSLDHAEQLARKSEFAASGEREHAFACWASGWVHAHRRQESAALLSLSRVISYARRARDPWLEASALQARGVARHNTRDAFDDWERSVTRFIVSGDLSHASNVRYMLASRAVESRIRLDSVPVWLDECESYASGRGLKHELAHIRRARASYEHLQGHSVAARRLLTEVLPVFQRAGDFRCIARTLCELAQPAITGNQAARTDLLLEALRAAAIASGPARHEQILADLIAAAVSAGDLVLATRCAGALEALSARAPREAAEPPLALPVDPVLTGTWRDPAYATFFSEGRAGGIGLLMALYPRSGHADRVIPA